MDKDNETQESNLFLVRLWLDPETGEGDDKQHNWHGKVQHVVTGKAGSFSSQSSMMHLLATMSTSTAQLNAKNVDPSSAISTDVQQQGT